MLRRLVHNRAMPGLAPLFEKKHNRAMALQKTKYVCVNIVLADDGNFAPMNKLLKHSTGNRCVNNMLIYAPQTQ